MMVSIRKLEVAFAARSEELRNVLAARAEDLDTVPHSTGVSMVR